MTERKDRPRTALRVLLVDDEPAMLRMLKTALGLYGYETVEATAGADALELLRNQSFDVIVSDVHMPGYRGLDFLSRVRELECTTPVIMISGKPSSEMAKAALERGAFQFLLKPVMPPVLKQAIEHAVLLRAPREPGE